MAFQLVGVQLQYPRHNGYALGIGYMDMPRVHYLRNTCVSFFDTPTHHDTSGTRWLIGDCEARSQMLIELGWDPYMQVQCFQDAYCSTYPWSDFFIEQARRQGGFEGVRANPPFDLQKILYTPLNCTF